MAEVGELQAGADGIGEPHVFVVHTTAEVQDDSADGIGGVATVAQQVVEGFVARLPLVLPERGEQIAERIDRDRKRGDRIGERHEHRMPRFAAVAVGELPLPPIQQFQAAARVGRFVGQIVGPTTVSVDIEKMLPQAARQQPTRDGKVFVVRFSQPLAIALRLGQRGGRRGARVRTESREFFQDAGGHVASVLGWR